MNINLIVQKNDFHSKNKGVIRIGKDIPYVDFL